MSLRASGPDVLLDVDVHAGAKADRFPDAYDPWRRRVKASVTEPALRGAANKALVRLVARFFHLGPGDVEVEHGATDSRKTLRLRGITVAHAEALLTEALA